LRRNFDNVRKYPKQRKKENYVVTSITFVNTPRIAKRVFDTPHSNSPLLTLDNERHFGTTPGGYPIYLRGLNFLNYVTEDDDDDAFHYYPEEIKQEVALDGVNQS